MNRITLDKSRAPPKPSTAVAQSGPSPSQTSQPPQRPINGAGAMAAASSPNQDGAGASGDNEEKGNNLLCLKRALLRYCTYA
jgi:hypothetical protein